jgi:hypothetical protein
MSSKTKSNDKSRITMNWEAAAPPTKAKIKRKRGRL